MTVEKHLMPGISFVDDQGQLVQKMGVERHKWRGSLVERSYLNLKEFCST